MADLLSLLRLNNMFPPSAIRLDPGLVDGGPGSGSGYSAGDNNPNFAPVGSIAPVPPPSGPSNMNPNANDIAMVSKMFPMQHEAADRLKAVLDTMPNRADYQPSRFQSIMAHIAGLGSVHPATYYRGAALGATNNPEEQFKTTEDIENAPYNKAVQDWELKLKPLQELSTAERYENSNSRIASNNYLQNQSRENRIQETERHDKEAEREREEQIENSRIRAKAYEAKNAHPNWKGYTEAGGQLVFVNPEDPTQQFWTGIDTGKLNDADKINLQIEGRMKEIGAQGAEQRKTENVKEGNRENLEGTKEVNRQSDITSRGGQTRQNIETRGDQQRQTNKEKPPTGTKAPKLGDEKVFPNGKVGRWDGTGWLDTGKTAK